MVVKWKKWQLDDLHCMLREAWEHNCLYMNEASGRPLADADADDLDGDGDRRERITVSEAVGYKLFMEVLMGAAARSSGEYELEARALENFDRAWGWARDNMQRSSLAHAFDPVSGSHVEIPKGRRDSLLAWRYVPGSGVIRRRPASREELFIDGLDGAPDGDLFTAASLRFAALLWPDREEYLAEAEDIARDIYAKYVTEIGGEPFLMGGENFIQISGINPSYSFEAVYDMMGELDPARAADWQRLKQTSMKAAIAGADSTLMAGGSHRIGGVLYRFEPRRVAGSSNMPPNWLSYDGVRFGDNEWFDAIDWISGWDGLRTLWMKAAFFLYDGNEAARKYLTDDTGTKADFGPYGFLKRHLDRRGELPSGFGIDGSFAGPELSALNLTEPNPFSLGIYLGYFYAAGDREAASKMLDGLIALYNTRTTDTGPLQIGEGTFAEVRSEEKLDYYGEYWAWFGMAMAAGAVEELFDLYKEWRGGNGMPGVVQAPFLPSYFEAAPGEIKFSRSRNLMKSHAWIDASDGCSARLLGGYLCRGRAKDWYSGGIGIGLEGGFEKAFDGIVLNVEGGQGRVKTELHSPDRIYTHEVPAANASSLYIPFASFREQIDHRPVGRDFDPKIDRVEKLQVIALGASADGPVDFKVKEIRAVKR